MPYDVVAGLVIDVVAPTAIRLYHPRFGEAAAVDAADFETYVSSDKDKSAASDVA